jgi:hypothetical protein
MGIFFDMTQGENLLAGPYSNPSVRERKNLRKEI